MDNVGADGKGKVLYVMMVGGREGVLSAEFDEESSGGGGASGAGRTGLGETSLGLLTTGQGEVSTALGFGAGGRGNRSLIVFDLVRAEPPAIGRGETSRKP